LGIYYREQILHVPRKIFKATATQSNAGTEKPGVFKTPGFWEALHPGENRYLQDNLRIRCYRLRLQKSKT